MQKCFGLRLHNQRRVLSCTSHFSPVLSFFLTYFLSCFLAFLLSCFLAFLLSSFLAFFLSSFLAFLLTFLLSCFLAFFAVVGALFFLPSFFLSYFLTFFLACLLSCFLAFLLSCCLFFFLSLFRCFLLSFFFFLSLPLVHFDSRNEREFIYFSRGTPGLCLEVASSRAGVRLPGEHLGSGPFRSSASIAQCARSMCSECARHFKIRNSWELHRHLRHVLRTRVDEGL